MALHKQVSRNAAVAWCPSSQHAHVLASGTLEGMIDDNFQTTSQLELYNANPARPGVDCELLGSIKVQNCFHSISWGSKGTATGDFPMGVVAGGMSDGAVCLWDANRVINGGGNPLVTRSETHTGPVLSLEFHPKQENLLASGSQDSHLYVWDLADPSKPSVSQPGQSTQQPAAISAVAWNKKVAHILASTNSRGETSVWDLRQKRVVITFRNSSHLSQVSGNSIAWNPLQARQLAVSYTHNVAEIWDLRHAMQPKAKLEGHQGNILSLAYCPHDPAVLLTSSEDRTMACWNSETGALLNQFASGDAAHFDLKWSPHVPSVVSSSSYDGTINVRSIQDTGAHAPAWLKRPVGASFAFGGKLTTFHKQAAPAAQPGQAPPKAPASLRVHQLSADQDLLSSCHALHEAMRSSDQRAFCRHKAETASTQQERDVWTHIDIMFDPDTRATFLKHLGHELPSHNADDDATTQAAAQQQQPQQPLHVNEAPIDDDDFFDNLGSESGKSSPQPQQQENQPEPDKEPKLLDLPKDEAFDAAVKSALLVGNFKSAVKLCTDKNRFADALMLASCAGEPLWKETQSLFFQRHPNPFMRQTMSAVVGQDLESLVNQADLSEWRDTLAMLLTFASHSESIGQDDKTAFRPLCNRLGQRLQSEANDVASATLCFITSCNADALLEIWSQSTNGQQLVSTVEKMFFFQAACRQRGLAPSTLLADKYSEYALLLAGQGSAEAALEFLNITQAGKQQDLASQVIADRIFGASDQTTDQVPPAKPFQELRIVGSLKVPANPAAQPQQQQQPNQRQQGFNNRQTGGVGAQGRQTQPRFNNSGPARPAMANSSQRGNQPPTRPGMRQQPNQQQPSPQGGAQQQPGAFNRQAPPNNVNQQPPQRQQPGTFNPNAANQQPPTRGRPVPNQGPVRRPPPNTSSSTGLRRPGRPMPNQPPQQPANTQPQHTQPPTQPSPRLLGSNQNGQSPRPIGNQQTPPPGTQTAMQANRSNSFTGMWPGKSTGAPQRGFVPPPSRPGTQPPPQLQPHQPQNPTHAPQQQLQQRPPAAPQRPGFGNAQALPQRPPMQQQQQQQMAPPQRNLPGRPMARGPPQTQPQQAGSFPGQVSRMSPNMQQQRPQPTHTQGPPRQPLQQQRQQPVAPQTNGAFHAQPPQRHHQQQHSQPQQQAAVSQRQGPQAGGINHTPTTQQPRQVSNPVVQQQPSPHQQQPHQQQPAVPSRRQIPNHVSPVAQQQQQQAPVGHANNNAQAAANSPALQQALASLRAVADEVQQAPLSQMELKKLADVGKKFDNLAKKIQQGLSATCQDRLPQIAQALSGRDYATASQLQVGLITTDWADSKGWLPGVKNLINLAKRHRS